jgi:hypothetical protein
LCVAVTEEGGQRVVLTFRPPSQAWNSKYFRAELWSVIPYGIDIDAAKTLGSSPSGIQQNKDKLHHSLTLGQGWIPAGVIRKNMPPTLEKKCSNFLHE